MITITNDKIQVCDGIDIVGMYLNTDGAIETVFLKTDNGYEWLELWDTVFPADIVDYLNNPDNSDRGSSCGSYYTLADALRCYYADNNFER